LKVTVERKIKVLKVLRAGANLSNSMGKLEIKEMCAGNKI